MQVLHDHKADTINGLIQENFDKRSIIFSDKSTNYINLSDYAEIHITETTLKWVHIAISNAKRTLLGVFH